MKQIEPVLLRLAELCALVFCAAVAVGLCLGLWACYVYDPSALDEKIATQATNLILQVCLWTAIPAAAHVFHKKQR